MTVAVIMPIVKTVSTVVNHPIKRILIFLNIWICRYVFQRDFLVKMDEVVYFFSHIVESLQADHDDLIGLIDTHELMCLSVLATIIAPPSVGIF